MKTFDSVMIVATGGNNRRWTKRYKKMLYTYDVLKAAKANKKLLEGYKLCMDTFKEEPKCNQQY